MKRRTNHKDILKRSWNGNFLRLGRLMRYDVLGYILFSRSLPHVKGLNAGLKVIDLQVWGVEISARQM